MKRDEILNMPAGNKMDVLVAEKILKMAPCDKWTVQRQTEIGPIHEKLFGSCQHDKCYPVDYPALYSTYMSAAWEVIDKLDCLFSVSRAWKLDNAEWKGFSCWIGGESVLAETAPLAICRAALLAVIDDRHRNSHRARFRTSRTDTRA